MALAKICDISALHTSGSAMGLTVLLFSLPALELLKILWSGRVSCHVFTQQWSPVLPGGAAINTQRLLEQERAALYSLAYLYTLHLTTPRKHLPLGTTFSFPACSRMVKTEVSLIKSISGSKMTQLHPRVERTFLSDCDMILWHQNIIS